MVKKINIGLVGVGAIGTGLALNIQKHLSTRAVIKCVCDTNEVHVASFKQKLKIRPRLLSLKDLVAKSDIIIEAASSSISGVVVEMGLRAHKKVFVMSIGGLLRVKGLKKLLAATKGELLLPSGAIAGLDAIASARVAKITHATLTTSKPIKGLVGAPYFDQHDIDIEKIKKPTIVFEGTARQAIKYFPKNINVAVLLSFATLGPDKVRVKIVTSPTFTRNTHHLEVEGSFGKITTITENVPSPDNPKTSYLAVLSAFATLQKHIDPFKIGT